MTQKDGFMHLDDGVIEFITLTKEGKYAPIDKESLPYSRIKEEADNTRSCQEMYYNLA